MKRQEKQIVKWQEHAKRQCFQQFGRNLPREKHTHSRLTMLWEFRNLSRRRWGCLTCQPIYAHLIKALRNKIGGKSFLESLLVLERVVWLRVGHAARLEPTIEDLVDASQVAFALFRRNRDVIDATSHQWHEEYSIWGTLEKLRPFTQWARQYFLND